MKARRYPSLPLAAEIPCRHCGNYADSYYWYMAGSACPKCRALWTAQLEDHELAAWKDSDADTVELQRTNGNFVSSIFGPAGFSYVPDVQAMSFAADHE